MKTALIDLDGVCAQFDTAFKAVLDRCHGSFVEVPFPVKTWNWDREYYGKETANMAWEQVLRVDPGNFWGNLSVLDPEGLATIAKAMRQQTLNPYFVTTRPFKGAERISTWWLESNGVSYPSVIQSKNKAAIAKGIECEFAVEDKPENAQFILREMGTACRVYLVKYPYNQELWSDPYITPVNSLSEALQREGF